MQPVNPVTDRRGESLAWLAGITCLAAFLVLLIISLYGQSVVLFAAAWMCLGALGLWIVSGVQLHQQRLLEEERLELAALERERQDRLGGAKTIFDDTDADQMDKLAMGRRLRTMERYFVPIGALAVAAFYVFIGVRLFDSRIAFDIVSKAREARPGNPIPLFFTAVGIAFVTFLISRSALGLARIRGFHLVRAGGNAMFGVTIATLIAGVSVGLTSIIDNPNIGPIVAGIMGAIMLVLALEIVLNFVFDFYRPRVADAAPRSFYDSRLLGMFSEPGGILKSMADALDYQFGFKVSETWFYRLLGRWIIPLLLVQALALWLLTSISVVPQGYRGVLEQAGMGTSKLEVLEPGIHITAPWPRSRVTLLPTERVQRIELGYDASQEPAHRSTTDPELWTIKHRKMEYGILVPDRAAAADKSVPLNILSVTMPIQYRVKADKVLDYHRNATKVAELVESHAYRVLTRFAAASDIQDLLSTGGATAAEHVRTDLQAALDRGASDGGDLGVEIIHLSLANIHPLTVAAEAYEQVMSSRQQKEAEIRRATGAANQIMVLAGGLSYQKLYDTIVAEEKSRDADADSAAKAKADVEQLLRDVAGGAARDIVATAERTAFYNVQNETSAATLFGSQVMAYSVAPDVYMRREHLRVFESMLTGIRKYVLALANNDRVVTQVDLTPPVSQGLLDTAVKGLQKKD